MSGKPLQPATDLLAKQLQSFIDGMPFGREVGISILEARRGRVCLEMDSKPKLMNHFGTYQAGALFTLAEITGGVLCGTFLDLSKNFLITKTGEIEFLKACSGQVYGRSELAEDKIEKANRLLLNSKKADVSVKALLQDAEGNSIAVCRLVYYLRLGLPAQFKRS